MADTVSCALGSCRLASRQHTLLSNLVEGRGGRRGGGGGAEGGGGGRVWGRGGVGVAVVVGGGRQPALCLKSGVRVLVCLWPASQCRDRARWSVLADATCRPSIASDVTRSRAPDFISGSDRGSGVIGDGVVRISRHRAARHRGSEGRKFLPIFVCSHNKNSDELRNPSSSTRKASKQASSNNSNPPSPSSSSSSSSHSASLLQSHPRYHHHHHRRRRWTLARLLAWFRLMRFLMKRRIAALTEPAIIAMKRHRWLPAAMAGVLFAMVVLVVDHLTPKPPPPRLVLYSQFVNEVRDHKVKRVQFEEGSNRLYFDLLEDETPVKSELMTKASTDAVTVAFSGQDRSLVKKEVMGGSSPSSPLEVERVQEDGSSTQGTLPTVLARSKRDLNSPFSAFDSLERVFNVWLQKQPVMVHKPSPPMVMKKKWRFATRRISGDEAFLLSMLRDAKVPHAVVHQPPSAALRNVFYTILALWIPLVPLLLFFRRAMGGSDSASKAKKRLQRDVKFSDVAGVDEAKAELQEIVNCLRDSGLYRKIGAQLPKGILLVGPPGTGKTLLAKAVAGEASIPFLAASASEFVELFVGRGAARVRELFAEARKVAPSIVFIDELDAVGGKRGTSFNEERDQTLNQLLTEMDGFESDTGVIVLAATNRPESLDPALCRPGRISRRVYVGAPNLKGREEILAVHMRKVKVQDSPDRICRIIALATPTCAGADLANIVNEAALLAARNGRDAVEMEDFLEAVDRALYGVGGKKDWRKSVKRQLDKWLGMDSMLNSTDSKENISQRKQLPWNRNQGPGINVATTQ